MRLKAAYLILRYIQISLLFSNNSIDSKLLKNRRKWISK